MHAELIDEQTALTHQIINQVKKMNMEEKKKLLIKLRKEEILEKVKSLDSVATA
jgi:DNA-directed RNA polymerase subunit H (RpoH/RPB5)